MWIAGFIDGVLACIAAYALLVAALAYALFGNVRLRPFGRQRLEADYIMGRPSK